MNGLKRICALLCTAGLCLALLAGCGAAAPAPDEGGKLKVVATIFPYYDFARAIGGDRLELSLLLTPGRESHSYEPTPLDVVSIQEADVFLYNGGEGEYWVDETRENMDVGDQLAVRMMDFVDAMEEELAEGMEAEPAHDATAIDSDEIEYDEHIWTSPVNAQRLATAICDAFCQADPDGAELYRKNCADYVAQLQTIDGEFRDVMADAKRTTMVFGDRFPLLYFCKTYGIAYRAAFQGCSADTEPSAKTLAFLIDKVKTEDIPVVYHLELSSEAISDAICEATGAKSLLFHACHNLSQAEFEAGVTYLDLMEANVAALREGLC